MNQLLKVITVFFFIFNNLAVATPLDAAKKGFVCGAQLTTLAAIVPSGGMRNENTSFTLKQLEDTNALTLKLPNEAPNIDSFTSEVSPISELSAGMRKKIAGRINGIVNFSAKEGDTETIGLTLRGRDSVSKYFSQVEASYLALVDSLKNDDIYSFNPAYQVPVFGKFVQFLESYAGSGAVAGVEVFDVIVDVSNLMSSSSSGSYSAFSLLLDSYLLVYYGDTFLGHYLSRDSNFTPFLKKVSSFLDSNDVAPRILHSAQTYKISPSTYSQATTGGFINSANLVKENHGVAYQPLRLFRRKEKPVYVMVDNILESWGPSEKDTQLHIVIRSSSTPFSKPKRPSSPIQSKEPQTVFKPALNFVKSR